MQTTQEGNATQAVKVFPGLTEAEMRDFGLTMPPTQDELPYSDGVPMESNLHVLQMYLLIETLKLHWEGRQDTFVGGNMFVYFSPRQEFTHDFRGPDFFAVQGVTKRDRKSWVVWEEGKGPDVVIELLSDSTADKDKNEKFLIYQDRLRVPEYFWFHPLTGELAGFVLQDGAYKPIEPDEQGRLVSHQLQLALAKWHGTFGDEQSSWLRWVTLENKLLPTGRERAEQAQQKADELEAILAQYRARFGKLPE